MSIKELNCIYAFGYGLSYTTFRYSQLHVPSKARTGEDWQVEVTVTNTGKRAGDEVVQLYVSHPQNGQERIPLRALKGFKRVHLEKGESQVVRFTLTPEELALVDKHGNLIQQAGAIQLYVGGGQPGLSEGTRQELTIDGVPYRVY